MEDKQKCKVAGCDKPAQIAVIVDGEPINCCRNHSTDVIGRAKRIKSKYKVEPMPPEP